MKYPYYFIGIIISLILLIIIILATIGNYTSYYKHNPVNKTIDLPEEIQLAKPNDILKVERVTEDSIIIGFKNKN